MIFIKINENREVHYKNFVPFHPELGLKKTYEQLLLEGYFVSAIPEPDPEEGNFYVLKLDADGALYYEYGMNEVVVDEVAELKKQIAEMQDAILEMAIMFEGAIS